MRSLLETLRRRARALVDRRALDGELDEELRFHIEQHVEKLVARGMSGAAARTEALRLFGGVEKVKEECRDERGVGLLDDLVEDLRHAARMLGRERAFAATAVLTLALGIGANTAIFSAVHGVLLAPLPYPDSDRLLLVEAHNTEFDEQLSILEFAALRERVDALDLVEHHGMTFTLLGHGYPTTVRTGVVSAIFFDVLGVEPMLGRTFAPSDERPEAEAVLVLSNELWRRQFDADPHVVGEVFEMNDRPHRVIGVLPPIPHYPIAFDIYMPTTACPFRADTAAGIAAGRFEHPYARFRNLNVFGRLRAGASLPEAQAQVAALADELARRDPELYEKLELTSTARPLRAALTERARPMLWTLAATVGLVLVIACANVANLNLARMLRRERELALRAAMGAGRGRLLRLALTEGMLLALLGGLVGLLLAAAGRGMLVQFIGRYTTSTAGIEIDLPVLAFTFLVSMLTGAAFGAVPALSSWRSLSGVLGDCDGDSVSAGRRAMRLRGALIVAQVALSFMLLVGAGLLLSSLYKLSRVDAGIGNENVLTAQVLTNWTVYDETHEVTEMFAALLDAVRDGPGVVAAAVSNTVPFADGGAGGAPPLIDFPVQERPSGAPPSTAAVLVPAESGHGAPTAGYPVRLAAVGISADYFSTLEVPIVEGRMISPAEFAARTPVALVSAAAQRHYWPGGSPIGARIAIQANDGVSTWHTVVGVAGDVRYYGLASPAPEAIYAPYTSFGGAGQLLVRTTADRQSITAFIREASARVAPSQAIEGFQTIAAARSGYLALPRLIAALIGSFALLALLLTVVGIGGVVAFSVGQRRHEIGIRMALGARRGRVVGVVLRRGLLLAVGGLGAGLLGALWFGGMVAGLLFETTPTDPATYVAVALVVLGASVSACLVPARRATTIDPVRALKAE